MIVWQIPTKVELITSLLPTREERIQGAIVLVFLCLALGIVHVMEAFSR